MTTRGRRWARRATIWFRTLTALRHEIHPRPASPAPARRPANRGAGAGRPTDPRGQVRRDEVVGPAYVLAARCLIGLLAPALLVFLPIGLLAAAALAGLADGSAAVLNGDFELIGTPGEPLLAWSAAVLVVLTAGQAVALPATVVLATGRLAGTTVSASGALRAAARRWPAMTVLVLVGVMIVAAALGLFLWLGADVVAYAAVAALALFAMPCLLAMAPVVLEGRSAIGALARAYRLAAGASPATSLKLAFGVVLVPALAARAASWAAAGLPIAPVVAGSVLALVTVPFQAAVIARLFLHRLVVKGTITEFDEIVDGLPAGPARPVRPAPVLTALLLPGLLYGGAVLVNPLGWPEVARTIVTENWLRDPDPDASEPDGRPKPAFGARDLRAMHSGPGGRLVMLMDGFEQAKLLTCLDSGCARSRFAWAEPVGAARSPAAAVARLADGRLVVSTWAQRGVGEDGQILDEDNWRAQLRLLICDVTACVPAPGGRPLREAASLRIGTTVALAARPGGGLLVAQLHELPSRGSDVDQEVLTITRCDDPACARPRTKEVARLPADRYADDRRELIAAVGPGDRAVVLRFDRDAGSISVISCDDPACARARVAQPVRGGRPDYVGDHDRSVGAALVLRADGRPLIAYHDMLDGTIRLLDCHTRACSTAGATTLSGPGDTAAPAMVLDRSGRALVAYQDLDRDRVILATCTETAPTAAAGAEGIRCTRTPVTTLRRGGYGLTMALDGHDRPVLAWTDFLAGSNDLHLILTRPLNLP